MIFFRKNRENRIFKMKDSSDVLQVLGISFTSKKKNESIECYEKTSDKTPETQKSLPVNK
jgi:hypothetical protein